MKKVIITGAGDIGRAAFQFLGGEFVHCFADNKKKGTEFLGKPVIPVEDLVNLKKDYVILLAMTNYANELKQQFCELGVDHYFHFCESIYFFEGVKKWNKRTVYEGRSLWACYRDYGLDQAVILGEKTEYSDFISELFGIEAVLEVNEVCRDPGRKYILNYTDDCICNDIIKQRLQTGGDGIFALPQTEHAQMTDEHRELAVFKNRHKGQRCFIIGNGPSLRTGDLDKLSENGEICFGLNVIHKLYADTKWRPTYVCMTDPLVLAQNYTALKEKNSCPVLVSDIKLLYHWETGENEYLIHEWMDRTGFSEDFSKGVYNGGTVTYAVMQLCAYMGFSSVYLLGMDCSNWGSHFNEDYWQKNEVYRVVPDESKIFKAYQRADEYAREHGFRIFNATRGGKLEIFERVDFDSL